jgi:hypothetical protein
MKHYHWEIQAYNVKFPYPKNTNAPKSQYQIGDLSIVDVLAESEKEAIEKAKSLIKKKFYRLGKMYECHTPDLDPTLGQDMQMTGLKMQAELLKTLKGGK